MSENTPFPVETVKKFRHRTLKQLYEEWERRYRVAPEVTKMRIQIAAKGIEITGYVLVHTDGLLEILTGRK